MLGIIMILLGVAAKIVMANGWFIIPNSVPTILFVLGGLLLLIQLLVYRKASSTINKHFNKW
jgi:hypothetical protein